MREDTNKLIAAPITGVDIRALPISPQDAFVLSRVDGRSTVSEIAFATGLPDPTVVAILTRLVKVGAVHLGGADQATSAAMPRPASAISGTHDLADVGPRSSSLRPLPAAAQVPLYTAQELAEPVAIGEERKRQILDWYYGLELLNFYELLGLERNADKKDIKDSYFEVVSVFHPDRYFGRELGTFKLKLERVFQRLTEANDCLSRRRSREEYDQALALAPALASAREMQRKELALRIREYFIAARKKAAAALDARQAAVAAASGRTEHSVSFRLPGAAQATPAGGTPAAASLEGGSRRTEGSVSFRLSGATPAAGTPAVASHNIASASARSEHSVNFRLPTGPLPTGPLPTGPLPAGPLPTGPMATGTPATGTPAAVAPAAAKSSPTATALPPQHASAHRAPSHETSAVAGLGDSQRPSGAERRATPIPPPSKPMPLQDAEARRRALARKIRQSFPPPASTRTPNTPRTAGVTVTATPARYVAMAEEALANNNPISATNALRIALSMNPDDAVIAARLAAVESQAAFLLADQYLAQARADESAGRYESAAEFYAKAALGKPSASVCEQAARCFLHARKDLRRAADFAKQALGFSPDKADLHLLLGRIYAEAGMKQSALNELERAVKLAPSDASIKDWLRRLKRGET